MAAIVVLGFCRHSIVCISSDEQWWDTTGGTRGKNNYWAYFLPKSFMHQPAQQKGLSLHCYYEMKNGQQISTQTSCLLYYLSFVSFWTGVDGVQFEAIRTH